MAIYSEVNPDASVELGHHAGHDVEVVMYDDDSVTVECLDCKEVLIEFQRWDEEEETS